MSSSHSRSVLIPSNRFIDISSAEKENFRHHMQNKPVNELSLDSIIQRHHNVPEKQENTDRSTHNSARHYTLTPNFGGVERPEKQLSRSSSQHSSRVTNNYATDYERSRVLSKPSRNGIPKLPLDSLLEEDSELNLSSIGQDAFEKNNAQKEQDTCILQNYMPGNESQDLINLLDVKEYESNTLQLSPVGNPKMYSRLDESSIVDPLCHVLVDSTPQFYNKNPAQTPEIKSILEKHSQKYDKALIILHAHFNSYKEQSEKQIQNLTQEIISAKNSLKGAAAFKQKLAGMFKDEMSSMKIELEGHYKDSLLKLETKVSENPKDNTSQRLKQLRKEYDKKLIENDSYIASLKKYNDDLKTQANSTRGYRDLIRENKKLREEISILWKDGPKARSRSHV